MSDEAVTIDGLDEIARDVGRFAAPLAQKQIATELKRDHVGLLQAIPSGPRSTGTLRASIQFRETETGAAISSVVGHAPYTRIAGRVTKSHPGTVDDFPWWSMERDVRDRVKAVGETIAEAIARAITQSDSGATLGGGSGG